MVIVIGFLFLVGTAVAVVIRIRSRYFVVKVIGSSMEPTYGAGQKVIAHRVSAVRIRRGDVVVIRDDEVAGGAAAPRAGRGASSVPCLIKRVAACPGEAVPPMVPGIADRVVPAGKVLLLGDNAEASHDSRVHGYYSLPQILGRVVG